MSPQKTFSTELINKLGHSPEPELGELVLHIPDPTTASILWKPSSLGSMNQLSLELIHQILEPLDFQSIIRFARASHKARAAVQGLPAYREMREHAPKVLVALGKTKVIKYFSAALLRQMLRTSQCGVCSQFAPFLSLATCERFCVRCIHHTRELYMMSADNIDFFDLEKEHLEGIPILHTIPGTHGAPNRVSHNHVYRLVLRLKVSERAAKLSGKRPLPNRVSERLFGLPFRGYHDLLSNPIRQIRFRGTDVYDMDTVSTFPPLDFDSMSCIRMPFLGSNGEGEEAQLCKGCLAVRDLHSSGTLPAHVLDKIVPEGGRPTLTVSEMATRLRLPEELLYHFQDCYGVHVLTRGEDEGLRM